MRVDGGVIFMGQSFGKTLPPCRDKSHYCRRQFITVPKSGKTLPRPKT
jgi:hypothetical protein